MPETMYNILVLIGYVSLSYHLCWGVDKLWWLYVDWYLERSKDKAKDIDKSTTLEPTAHASTDAASVAKKRGEVRWNFSNI